MRPTLANLATLLRNNLPSSVRTIIVGQVDAPKMDDLPQVQVFPESTTVALSGTVRDHQTRVINIRVVDSSKSKMGQIKFANQTISSMLAMCDFVEKKEASGAFSTTSIIGILRNNPTISGQVLYQDDIGVDYGSLGALGFPNVTADVKVQLQSKDLIK